MKKNNNNNDEKKVRENQKKDKEVKMSNEKITTEVVEKKKTKKGVSKKKEKVKEEIKEDASKNKEKVKEEIKEDASKNKEKEKINEKDTKKEEIKDKDVDTKKEEVKDKDVDTNKEDKTVVSKKKGKKTLTIILAALLAFIVLFVLYCFVFPFDMSIDLDGDKKTITGELSFDIKVNANKPIVNTYYAIDPVNKNDKKSYEKVSSKGSILNKKIEFNDLQIPVGKRKICIYVESFLFTSDVECKELEFDLGYVNEFDKNNVISIDDSTSAVKNELLIIFNKDANEEAIKELIEKYKGEIVGNIYYNKFYQVKFEVNGSRDLTNILEKISSEEIVDVVSYNFVFSTEEAYNVKDSSFKEDDWNSERPSGNNWHLELIEATGAWDLIKNPNRINVGVIDNPISNVHEDLRLPANNVFYLPSDDFKTYDDLVKYINDNESKGDFNNQHGTHVAGIISALHNDVGVAGVGLNVNLFYSNYWRFDYNYWDNNALFGTKSLGTKSDIASFILALSDLVMSNCRVINMSIGWTDYYDPEVLKNSNTVKNYIKLIDSEFESFDKAGKDFIITKSAGNYNKDASGYVFNYVFRHSDYANPHVIIVGAVDYIDASDVDEDSEIVYSKASFSNYGDYVDIFAPGVHIPSTIGKDRYRFMEGTSQAAPIVAGVAELVYSTNPNLKYNDVKSIIENSGVKAIDNNGKTAYIVNAKKAVQTALDYNGSISNTRKDKFGYVQGSIVDAKTDKPIEGNVDITARKIKGRGNYIANTTTGGYGVILPAGIYNITFNYEGYVSETIYNVVVTQGVVTYNVKLSMVDDKKDNGTINGSVKDAIVRDKKVPNATMQFYKGINNKDADDLVLTAQSDSNGDYEAVLEPGNYTVIVSADNYIAGKCYVVSIPGQKKNEQNCTVSPRLNEGEIRAVLTWDYLPYDLDSHLLGPAPGGKRFHIYYSNKNYDYNGVNYDNLDVDDTQSYGPETVSVYKNVEGEYVYLVHDYSNKSKTDSNSLANSSAQVKLYVYGKEDPYVFNVPNKPGTVWKVFKISNGEVEIINEMGYETNPEKVGK